MNLSLLPAGGPAMQPPGMDGVGLAASFVQSLQAPGAAPVVASQQVAAPSGNGPNFGVATGPGTMSRKAGPGGDIWASILSALKPGPSGAELPYGILDPKQQGDFMTGLAQKALAGGSKG